MTAAAIPLANDCSQPGIVFQTLAECPLCFGTSLRRLPTPGRWIGERIFSRCDGVLGLQRCRNCSLVFVNPRPSQTLLDSFYDSDSYVCHDPKSGDSKTAQLLMECVAHHGPYPGKRFMDFGCGGGFLLKAALDNNWDAVGYDVGQRALASCRSRGFAVTNDLSSLSRGFDVVFLNHVFEHLASPGNVLSQCRRLLGKNGKLFVVVPNLSGLRARMSLPVLSRRFNVDERHRAFPIHLFYFTPRTLSLTLERNGFRVVNVETFGLGIYEFLNRPDAEVGRAKLSTAKSTDARVKPNVPPVRSKNSAVRSIVKQTLFRAGLGENLILTAQPA